MTNFKLHLPIPGPFATPSDLVASPYDVSSSNPAQWHQGIELVTPEGDMVAICSGDLSTVPPFELPNNNVAPLSPPLGAPATVTLYLRPLLLLPDALRVFNQTLFTSFLGSSLRCFVYRNVELAQLHPSVLLAIAGFKPLDEPDPKTVEPGQPRTRFDNPLDRLSLFAQGEFSVPVAGGAKLGKAAGTQGSRHLDFEVWTSFGRVDPMAFFAAFADFVVTPDFQVFQSRIAAGWPAPGLTNLSSALTSCATRLFPYPALREARGRLGILPSDWVTIGDAQKAIYWGQLLVRAGFSSGGPPFVFRLTDIENPFQLEAVSEFFINWPLPAAGPPSPPLPQVPPNNVSQRGGSHLVLIDPFDVLATPGEPLPGPAFELAPYVPLGPPCAPGASSGADLYRGVLFVVDGGDVQGWFRWSSYSSRRWEDSSQVLRDDVGMPVVGGSSTPQPLCSWASSILGNGGYAFRSDVAQKSSFINFGFLVFTIGSPSGNAPVRRYFEPSSPISAPHPQILLHAGLSADLANPFFSYNGSNGGLVSPAFYRFRNLMIELYLRAFESTHQGTDTRVLPLRNTDAAASVAAFKDDDDMKTDWKNLITGACWVIRPDEPLGR